LKTLLISTTVFTTVLAALGFGILSGYVAISGILRALGRQQQKRSAPPAMALGASMGAFKARAGGGAGAD